MKLKSVEVGPTYIGYGEGATPGIQCKVELQVGEYSYNTAKITLDEAATKRVVAAIVAEAMATLTFDETSINVVGTPGKTPPVDESPVAVAVDELVM